MIQSINGKQYRKKLLETRTFTDLGNGKVEAKLNCDKNCKDCILLTSGRCIYEIQESWQVWANKQREERMKGMKLYDFKRNIRTS